MKRTEPQTIGDILEQLLRSPDIAAKIAEGALPETWRRVVGPLVAEHTRHVRFVKGTLYVHVNSSVVRSELMMQRIALVNAINAEAGIDLVKQLVVQ